MEITFDPDEVPLERVIAVGDARYDVRLSIEEAEQVRRKMRH